jgi:hypothetical protein
MVGRDDASALCPVEGGFVRQGSLKGIKVEADEDEQVVFSADSVVMTEICSVHFGPLELSN